MDSDPIFPTHDPIRERLEAAMPWVGGYIAAASAFCTVAMAADAFNVFRHKKLWLPCQYFSLNATSLTLLAVATKLPMDLTTSMIYTDADLLAKFNSIVFLSTAMANFMSSLGSTSDKDIRANVVALAILVITVAADVLLQLVVLYTFRFSISYFIFFYTIFMLLLLATIVSLAVSVPTTKRSLESMYQEKHKAALRGEEGSEREKEAFTIDEQREKMMKYWVMAETSNPQFVMARSVVCTTSALVCLLSVVTLVIASVICLTGERETGSPYGDSTKWILYIQTIGVAVGSVAPMLRWFVVVSFKCSRTMPSRKDLKRTMSSTSAFRKVIKIETYWTQTLVDWRDNFSRLQIWHSKLRKYLHNAKWFAITFCICLQTFTVLLSKLFIFISALLMTPFFLCYTRIKNFMKQQQIGGETDSELRGFYQEYVLVLDGELELPTRVLSDICRGANNTIQIGRKKQPRHLIKLLSKFTDFRGVGKFDSNQIPSLQSQEPPNCWTLPVVTLTSIAIALPFVAEHERKQLLSSVREGLSLAKLVDKIHDKNDHIRKAADISWVEVVLYMKWLEIDLKEMHLHSESPKEVLEKLSNKAEAVVNEFKKRVKDPTMEINPLNWPAKVIAANSMSRISRTILLLCEGELFEQISAMIADILAASLTNLPLVITRMCHRNAIEKREKSVRKTFLLLGKTEKIVQIVQRQKRPSLDDDKAVSVDEWRALFQQDDDESPNTASASTEEIAIATTEHLAIKVEC